MQKLKSITTWFHFKFSLALKGIFLSSDWPSWLLWFWFYNTQSKTFYVTSVVVITLCGENHVIPSKILLFPPPPLPAPLMRNNDWSSTVTLSFSLHNVSREMFLQAATSCARASSPCPRLVILNRVNRLTDWLTCCLTELRLFLIFHVLWCVIRIRYVLSTKKLFILPSPVTVWWLANWL